MRLRLHSLKKPDFRPPRPLGGPKRSKELERASTLQIVGPDKPGHVVVG